MGISFRAHGAETAPGFSYSDIQYARVLLLKAARAKLGKEAWDTAVKFSWMLSDDEDADKPIYDVVEGLETNPWWDGRLADMPTWLPGLLAFVDKSDTDPTWSWGQAAEIAEMLLALDPKGEICSHALGFLFKHAALHRVCVYGS